MRFLKCVAIVAAALAAVENIATAYQKIDLPRIKTQKKQEQLGPVEFITPENLKARITKNEPLLIVDLRAQTSFEQSDKTIKGSFHTKVRKVAYRLREHPRNQEIVTYCACPSDEAAIIAARDLQSSGFTRVRVLQGGWNAWLKAGGQVEPKPKL